METATTDDTNYSNSNNEDDNSNNEDNSDSDNGNQEVKSGQQAPAQEDSQTSSSVIVMTDPSPSSGTGRPTVEAPKYPPLPLDWTKLGQPAEEPPPKRYPHDVMDILEEDEEIVIVGTAGQKITIIGEDFSEKWNPKLSQLVLRSHMIKKMQGLENFKQLELLELYDNVVDALDCLEGPGPSLRTLDMSYNVIREMAPVALCPNLKELYLANNKIKTMAGLGGLKHLRKLDLGANRIRIMDGKELSGLENLEELWIGKNKIEKIEGLEKLTKLRRLDVQSNRLTSVDNLTTQEETLEELYLSHNAIDNEGASQATGIPLKFPNLSVLDLCRNKLTNTAPFAHLEGLEELWLSGNQIETFEDLAPLKIIDENGNPRTSGQQLETVYLEYNPVAKEFEYRKRLAEWIPCLKQIDATMIGGLGSHGIPSGVPSVLKKSGIVAAGGPIESVEDQMRRMQTAAIERAKAETEAKKRQEQEASQTKE